MYENDRWKDLLFLDFNRAKGTLTEPVVISGSFVGQTKRYETTANHWDAGGSAAYTFSPRTFVVGAARYDHDDFAANRWQEVVAVGLGYVLLKNPRSELSLSLGPGYKRYQPQSFATVSTSVKPPVVVQVTPASLSEVIARGRVHYKVALTQAVSLDETFLAEMGAKNSYYQNDIGVAVTLTNTLALRVGYVNRYNTNTVPGAEHMETLFTTNLVYRFGQSETGASSDCNLSQINNVRPQTKPSGKRVYAGNRRKSNRAPCEN